jgi:hypothetical protein
VQKRICVSDLDVAFIFSHYKRAFGLSVSWVNIKFALRKYQDFVKKSKIPKAKNGHKTDSFDCF